MKFKFHFSFLLWGFAVHYWPKSAWKQYVELGRRIRQETDPEQKEKLVTERLELAIKYGFPVSTGTWKWMPST